MWLEGWAGVEGLHGSEGSLQLAAPISVALQEAADTGSWEPSDNM